MKKFRIGYLLLLFVFVQTYGQNSVIDDLQLKLKATTEIEERVTLLTDIGFEYYAGQVYFDSAFYYVEKAHLLAAENEAESAEAIILSWHDSEFLKEP